MLIPCSICTDMPTDAHVNAWALPDPFRAIRDNLQFRHLPK